jgi:hypothetical protein
MAPGSVRREKSTNQAKKSVVSDDSLPEMGVQMQKVKVRPGFAISGDRDQAVMTSGKVTETCVPLPTSLWISSWP